MLYESTVRSVATLISQWRLVARSFENVVLDLQQYQRHIEQGKSDRWPWRNVHGDSLLTDQAEYLKWDIDVPHAEGAPANKDSILGRTEAEVARLLIELRKLEEGRILRHDKKTLLEDAIEQVTGIFERTLGVLASANPSKAGIRTDFNYRYIVPDLDLGFPLQPLDPIVVTDGGAGYVTEPAVTINGGGGAGAKAEAVIDKTSGSVTAIHVTDPGTGYTSVPTITIAAPPAAAGARVATALVIQLPFDAVVPAEDPLLSITVARERLDDLERFIVRQVDDFGVAVSTIGPGLNLQGIRSGIEDLGAYPILTTDLGPSGYSRGGPASAPAAGGTSFQRLVDGALRGVLGRSPQSGDTRSFLAALDQTFVVSEVQGRSVVTYQPRSFSGQTELGGGVTGAQASLYARASLALENSRPLLEELYPLLPDADPQEAEAIRAIVRGEFIEIVGELKTEGGPRTARVDRLLDQLIGQENDDGSFQGGHLDDLADEFGFDDQANINTLEEESNASNFIAVKDYAKQIFFGWTEFRDHYYGKDLGTRFVLLSRALSVAAEAVQEVYAAMDSVFVGQAERQVSSFNDPRYKRPIMISELLSWITSFTTSEAPRLVLEGGRKGAEAIQPTAMLLESLVSQLINVLASDPGLPKGLQHPRVRFPLQELRGYLDHAQQLAEDIRAPLRSASL